MKKMYYVAPFVLIPILMLIFEHLHNVNGVELSSLTISILIVLISAFVGNLSPTDRKWDYPIAIIMPISFFIFLFIVGFLDKDDLETRFHLDRAFRCAFQEIYLILYGIMTAITFLASFKPIRIAQKIKSKY